MRRPPTDYQCSHSNDNALADPFEARRRRCTCWSKCTRCLPPATCSERLGKAAITTAARARRLQKHECPVGAERKRELSAARASQVDAPSRQPVSCFIATRAFWGLPAMTRPAPTSSGHGSGPERKKERDRQGTAFQSPSKRCRSIRAYGYAIIGGVGPAEFYANTLGAIPSRAPSPAFIAGCRSGGQKHGQDRDRGPPRAAGLEAAAGRLGGTEATLDEVGSTWPLADDVNRSSRWICGASRASGRRRRAARTRRS